MTTTNLASANTLGATFTTSAVDIPTTYYSDIAIAVTLDNGAGAAPADSPSGLFTLQVSLDGGTTYFDFVDLNAALANVSPAGNNAVINGLVVIRAVPGNKARLKYTRTSGGATTTRCSVWLSAL